MNSLDLELLANVASKLPVDATVSIGLEWHHDRAPTVIYQISAGGEKHFHLRATGCERTKESVAGYDFDAQALEYLASQLVAHL